MDNLEDQVRRLRDQVSMIGETLIESNEFPIERLMISMDWGNDELRDARGIFRRFEEQLSTCTE